MHAVTMDPLTQRYEAQRHALFGLCYRMTGSAADAEDLVQATFQRALERPPKDLDAPLRPWLFRVATNLCIDALRRRKREDYFGPWLPSPVETERLVRDLAPGPDARYDLAESATSAFLVALEALDAKQRAVLVLRDVVGLTGPETAELLDTSPGNVRVVLHRARKALETYDASRRPPSPELRDKSARLLRELVMRLSLGDTQGVLRMLADEVTSVHDGGGEYIAAVRPLTGPRDVVRFYDNIAGVRWPISVEERELNGLPAFVIRYPEAEGRYATRAVVWVELDRADKIVGIRVVLASAKLTAIDFA